MEKLNFVIESFQTKYQNQVIDLISNIQQNEFFIKITPAEQPDLKNISEFYQKNNGNFWIATCGDKVIGTIALLDIENNKAALRKMFVDKDYRGKEIGIAKQLLDNLLDWAKEHNIKTIFLGTTPAFLAAHRFYEKNGFTEITEQDLPKNFPIINVDKKFYKKSL
ncbi:TPA: GNAT family N-acetyltransferase [Candidatus Dependentiae bacterium]|nr:MAG: N-acetyltransferase 8-like protein [candidate division TM6 bacterium GW2011_GWE2_31_21]KKP53992.1 MAG: N-acetyltransferase 8-like protein [candidate division TM6 bacterium GW2011_GWF2_33_332]HBS48427.1 GNAT family N-acetyltransferase [Candidatus Dependentiae bacterium]HBZ72899.1 GNAT family N-acetyltransferase [Candidatus Dependentiae bacterium]